MQLLPENWPAWRLFSEVSTQWRVGTGGAYALDYLVLFRRMDDLGLAGAEREDMFQDIRVIEAAALAQMRAEPGHLLGPDE